ncbi:hypothetical protein FRC17_005516 [Serendipita sp. 399]|nr:hypothetical protein FRC17_005516 [Serendipita sp. 399]
MTARSFSSTPLRMSYVGTAPISIPSGVTVERIVLDKASSQESKISGRTNQGPSAEERIVIRGSEGETSIKLYDFMRFTLPASGENAAPTPHSTQTERKVKRRNPPCPEDATNEPFTLAGGDPQPQLTLYVENPTNKKQRQLWGSTRTLISNAIKGQTEGFTLPLYLIGVGYRAALELDRAPKAAAPVSSSHTADEKSRIVECTTKEVLPRRRLALRLGYSHVIYLPVPQDIKLTVPSPTIISLSCKDKQRVGQFAADIRKLRPPEVFKGKGIFVGDEKIRLKAGKKK